MGQYHLKSGHRTWLRLLVEEGNKIAKGKAEERRVTPSKPSKALRDQCKVKQRSRNGSKSTRTRQRARTNPYQPSALSREGKSNNPKTAHKYNKGAKPSSHANPHLLEFPYSNDPTFYLLFFPAIFQRLSMNRGRPYMQPCMLIAHTFIGLGSYNRMRSQRLGHGKFGATGNGW